MAVHMCNGMRCVYSSVDRAKRQNLATQHISYASAADVLQLSPPPALQSFKVVLVSPKTPANIGAAMRLCENFEAYNLCVVAPRCDVHGEEVSLVSRQSRLLELVTIENDLAAALAPCGSSIGFTRRTGGRRPVYDHLAHLDSALPDALPAPGGEVSQLPTALVFGREESGLTAEETDLCSVLCSLPTGRLQPSLNLSHAIAVVLSQLFQRQAFPPSTPPSAAPSTRSSNGLSLRPHDLESHSQPAPMHSAAATQITAAAATEESQQTAVGASNTSNNTTVANTGVLPSTTTGLGSTPLDSQSQRAAAGTSSTSDSKSSDSAFSGSTISASCTSSKSDSTFPEGTFSTSITANSTSSASAAVGVYSRARVSGKVFEIGELRAKKALEAASQGEVEKLLERLQSLAVQVDMEPATDGVSGMRKRRLVALMRGLMTRGKVTTQEVRILHSFVTAINERLPSER